MDRLKDLVQKWLAKMESLKGTPYSLAAGLACGAAVSFTPFIGLHTVLALLTAWIIRGNLISAALGTAVGNPWTFPFIWMAVLYTGRWMLGGVYEDPGTINFGHFFSRAFHALMNFDFDLFFNDIWPILWPMIVGCIPFYVAMWLLTYYSVKHLLEKINRKRAHKTANEIGKLRIKD